MLSQESVKVKDLTIKAIELPAQLRHEMARFISDSTVAMFGHGKSHESLPGVYGSGSLVIVNSIHGILTARHVWETLWKNVRVSNISFSVTGKNDYIHEEKAHLRAYYSDDENADICFIQLPQPVLGTLKARRTFYPIRYENLPAIEEIRELMWVTAGFPLEWQPQNEKIARPIFYYTHVTAYRELEGGWDEIELQVNYDLSTKPLPSSLEGMSGGGIWNFRVFCREKAGLREYGIESGERILKSNLLVGVNFWQTELKNKTRKVRGMGPVSVYKRMTELVNP